MTSTTNILSTVVSGATSLMSHNNTSTMDTASDQTFNDTGLSNESFVWLSGNGSLFHRSNNTTIHNAFDHRSNNDLKDIVDVLLLTFLILIMTAMGCEITWRNLWNHIRRPVGLSIGIVSQFGVKPLAAYGLLLLAGTDGLHATGVLIIACCPGGVTSNTFTYFSDGDLPLSVAMTTISTVMAMGMLPANILLYGRSFESVNLVIPYASMALSLVIVTSPIIVGMLLKWKLPRVARWVTRIGTYSGLALMLACVIIEVVIFPDMFTSVPLKLYAIILALPIVGLALGYGIAAALRQNVPVCKTIAIECGIQNFPLALTIIALSFPMEVQEDIVLLPLLYGVSMIVVCSVLCGIYVVCKRFKLRKNEKKCQLSTVNDGLDEAEKEDLIVSNGIHIQMHASQAKTNGQLMLNGNNSAKI